MPAVGCHNILTGFFIFVRKCAIIDLFNLLFNKVSISRPSIKDFLTNFAFAQEKEERLNLSFTSEARIEIGSASM
jgi:hypothetical protein